jgi:hypothetical protein
MAKPMVKIVNAETGEEIEREMNAAEFAQYKVDQEASIARLADEATKAAAKTALLERLGISADEALLLLS